MTNFTSDNIYLSDPNSELEKTNDETASEGVLASFPPIAINCKNPLMGLVEG